MDGKILTYFPYQDSCGSNITPASVSLKNFFPTKIPIDLNRCEVRMMGLYLPPYVIDTKSNRDDPTASGLEVTIMHIIAQKMNFSEKYIGNPYSHWGYLLGNGSFTMMLKELHEGNVDIVFGMMIGNNSITSYFSGTAYHIDTAAIWFVPTALQIAQWKNLTVIFDPEVWLAILIIFIINGFIWWLIGRNKENINEFTDLVLAVMSSFHILLQGSVKNPRTGLLRILVLLWSISSLLLFTAHQCQLTGILTSPLYEHQISNLEELVTSKLKFGFYPILLDLYGDKKNWIHRTIQEKYIPCTLGNECMNRTAYERNFAVIKNRRQGKYLIPRIFSYLNGLPMLYTFNEVEFVVWVRYFTKKGFPLLQRMDHLIHLLQSSGLIAKWEGDIVFMRNKGLSHVGNESLTINHLEGAFYLLIIGLIAAVFAFLIEIMYFKLKK